MELFPLFDNYTYLHCLDLGCGIGRNSIPLAQHFPGIPCHIDCVDILQLAIEKLLFNANKYHVSDSIHGIVASIDNYHIQPHLYDLILAISALEHVNSRDTFVKKLSEIQLGLRSGGIACLIVNTNVRERDKASGLVVPAQFEVNLSTSELEQLLTKTFRSCQVLKHTVIHQRYDIPRQHGLSDLETDVITWVVRKP